MHDRRRFLALVGTVAGAGLSGCLTGDGTRRGTESPGSNVGSGEDIGSLGSDVRSGLQYTPSSPNWSGTLLPENGPEIEEFGDHVAVSGDGSVVIVGGEVAIGDSEVGGEQLPSGGGAAWVSVFERRDSDWRRRTRLVPQDGGRRLFSLDAISVSADGATAVVAGSAVLGDGASDREIGVVGFVFTRTDGGWTRRRALSPDGSTQPGPPVESMALSADGTTAAVGVQLADPDGRVHVFERVAGEWEQHAQLEPEDPPLNAAFGKSVSLSADGTSLVVGSANLRSFAYSTGVSDPAAGRAVVFDRDGDSWQRVADLSHRGVGVDGRDRFGHGVAISADGSTVLVGAPGSGARPTPPPSVSTPTPTGPDGTYQPTGPDDTAQPTDGGDIGPVGTDEYGTSYRGNCYVFERGGDGWQQQTLIPSQEGRVGELFGYGVSVSDDGTTALVVARNVDMERDDRAIAPGDTGGAKVYRLSRSGGDWEVRAELSPRGSAGETALSGNGRTVFLDGDVDGRPGFVLAYEFD